MQRKEAYEELILIYQCQGCAVRTHFGFVTRFDETISNEQELIDVLEKTPCHKCRFERLKFIEKRLVFRVRDL